MTNTDHVDEKIEDLIDDLTREYRATGLFSAPTPERKAEIIDQIATLRASLSPTTINNNYGPQS